MGRNTGRSRTRTGRPCRGLPLATNERRRRTMRGRGRVYRRKSGYSKKLTAVWWLDYSVDGKRYRESSGLEVGKATKLEAGEVLEQRIKDRKNGRPVEPPAPSTLRAYVAVHLAAKAEETDKHGQKITTQW